MTPIKPRWEWRSFGHQFGPAASKLTAHAPVGEQEGDEIYLLTDAGGNVKVRDALIDIKALRTVDARGLELWTPIMKAGFPLAPADAARVLESLQLPAATQGCSSETLDAFLSQCVPPGAIRVVKVHKRRTRYRVDGCMAELTDVVANGRPTRTIAVESEDPDAVLQCLRTLGVNGYTNTSYPRGLAALIDDRPERYAIIDAGTNSIKFHIAERGERGEWRTVVDRAELTRLGEGMARSALISDASIERTAAAIAGMAAEAKEHGVRAIAAVGTAGLRMASNGAAVVEAIAARTGVSIDVISGDDEARLASRAALVGLGLNSASIVVFDTGGGSSQFSFMNGSRLDDRFSLDVGAVRYTERFQLADTVSSAVLQDARTAIADDLARLDARPRPDRVVGMGGAATNLAAIKHRLTNYDAAVVHGTVLDRAEVQRQIELFRTSDAATRRTIAGLQPKRADVILAGACIVEAVMTKLGAESVTVSDRGLRHGVLVDRFEE